MNRSQAASDVTRAARLTPAIPAAIATIAVRGARAGEVLAGSFRAASGRAPDWRTGEVRFGLWMLRGSDIPPEHVVVCQIENQHFEIHCHGGLAVCEWILSDLEASDCEICAAADWPASRAGRVEAAAELALTRAATLKVAAVLLDQFSGSLTRELESLATAIGASQLGRAREICAELLHWADFGMKLLEPWRLTLAGPPNVGKSSLTNALVGAARVLVHHEPGTTRDAVETSIVVSSWPVVLTDTAGVRPPAESIERLGIDAAWLRWQSADIGLLVVDATVGWTPVHSELLSRRSAPTVLVLNKSDLQPTAALPEEALASVSGLSSVAGRVKMIATDATGPAGVAELIAALGRHFDALMPPAGSGVPFLTEQVMLLRDVERQLGEGQADAARQRIANYLYDPGCSAFSAVSLRPLR